MSIVVLQKVFDRSFRLTLLAIVAIYSLQMSASANERILIKGADALPTPEQWGAHFLDVRKPWMKGPIVGTTELGDFPTFLLPNGKVPQLGQAETEKWIASLPGWIGNEVGRKYPRMNSRRIAADLLGFQITGDRRHLRHAVAGWQWLKKNAYIDKAKPGRGGVYNFFKKDGTANTEEALNTAQNQAYVGGLGAAAMFATTGDPIALEVLNRHREHIFNTFWDESQGMLRETPNGGNQELVSQLDQLTAYLIPVAPHLPKSMRREWYNNIEQCVSAMLKHFHNDKEMLFWGAADAGEKVIGKNFHTDNGHTMKSYWMLHLAGRLFIDAAKDLRNSTQKAKWTDLGDTWTAIAEKGSMATFKRALITERNTFCAVDHEDYYGIAKERAPRYEQKYYKNTWAWKLTGSEGKAPYKEVLPGTEWWSYAVMGQSAGYFALNFAHKKQHDLAEQCVRYLAKTTPRWFMLLNPRRGGIEHSLINKDVVPFPWLHHWKANWHEFEKVYMAKATQHAMLDQPVKLSVALHPDAHSTFVPRVWGFGAGKIIHDKRGTSLGVQSKPGRNFRSKEVQFRRIR